MTDAVMHTARLRLRLLDARDAALYRALYTCPQVMHRIMPPMTVAAADAAFERSCRHNRADCPGHRFWTLEQLEDGMGVGMAALLRRRDEAELGVLVRPRWWKCGISSEAFAPLLRHAFGAMALHRVVAERPDDDHAQIIDRLLAPFGFERAIDEDVPQGHCRWGLPARRWRSAADGGWL